MLFSLPFTTLTLNDHVFVHFTPHPYRCQGDIRGDSGAVGAGPFAKCDDMKLNCDRPRLHIAVARIDMPRGHRICALKQLPNPTVAYLTNSSLMGAHTINGALRLSVGVNIGVNRHKSRSPSLAVLYVPSLKTDKKVIVDGRKWEGIGYKVFLMWSTVLVALVWAKVLTVFCEEGIDDRAIVGYVGVKRTIGEAPAVTEAWSRVLHVDD